MRYCSIDLETTGLDHRFCQMIEFGAVIDDLDDPKPIDALPRFHRYIIRDRYVGEPFALSMHAEIFRRIANREPGFTYNTPEQAHSSFGVFLAEHGLIAGNKLDVNVAGKNFFGFDYRFLEDDGWVKPCCFRFHRRVLDPAALYFDPHTDKQLPSLKECLQRAGVDKEVGHTAIEDALDVIKVIRKMFVVQPRSKRYF